MLGWQHPAALWTLALAAVPVVIHLLRTHHAKRVPFPTLRFVQPSRAAAVRMRLPSDLLLLLLRMAVVLLAAAAAAGPILLTDARLAAWNARVARAVVVDTSRSMREAIGADAPLTVAAQEAADAELGTAAFGARFDVRRIDEGITRASRWLAEQPPARREVVVISDLQVSAFTTDAPDRLVVPGTGLRFVSVGRPSVRRDFDGESLLGGAASNRRQQIGLTRDTTAVVTDEFGESGTPGLRLLGPPQAEASIARLLRAVGTAGAYAASRTEPVAIRFSGASAPLPEPLTVVRPGWMLDTALRLRASASLAAAAASTTLPKPAFGSEVEPWSTVARDASGATLVRAAAANGELIIDIAAAPDDVLAAVAVQAALDARVEARPYDEYEIAALDDGAIARMARQAGPVTRDAWRAAERTDARWCWLAALILIGVEQWLRSRHARRQASPEVASVAA
jgi:hypothetical protein